MNLRAIANSAIQVVNRDVTVDIRRSLGFTTGPGLRQVPQYDTAVSGPAQIQALDSEDLKHIDGLNIQGVPRAIYIRGSLAAVVRPDQKGGDFVTVTNAGVNSSLRNGDTFLIVTVLESWNDWTKAVIQYQGNNS